MIQGTGSNVGKSTLVAGLARALTRRGLRVAPFKPQNMSNNAAVTADGGEIGRAQALQAQAARRAPSVHMNPVLLKPESDTGAQVILRGKKYDTWSAGSFAERRRALLPAVLESFEHLAASADIVLVEGAGSAAETNLRAGDIANMGFASAARVPVVLAGDIDRGGIIASLVGTQAVLDPADAALIRGFLVNKFRGDPRLFDAGVATIVARTGWPCLGVVPWLPATASLPAEDAFDLRAAPGGDGPLHIAVPMLPRIANFDDFDPLKLERGVRLTFVPPGEALPGDCALVILPGSKSTLADLAFFRAQGWDVDLAAHRRRGGHILGLCGGYQMLGRKLADPSGVEGPAMTIDGLGLLDIATIMHADKNVMPVKAVHLASGLDVTGYEIHLGRSEGQDCARPMLDIDGRRDGAISADGRVAGTYVHGLFAADAFRRAYLASFGVASELGYGAAVETALDALADHCEAHIDIDALLAIARLGA
jgi:adenosylcobyric acid synthase